MAENNDAQEKTEEPTPRRREQAREQGQVARSRDLTTTALLLGAIGLTMLFAPWIEAHISELGRRAWQIDPTLLRSPDAMFEVLRAGAWLGSLAALPVVLGVTVVGVLSMVVLGGVAFSTDALMPKASRIDPLAGLGRMFSMRALVELGKSLLKLVVVGVPVCWLLATLADDLLALAFADVLGAMRSASALVGYGFLGMAAATAIIAMVDVPWQLYDFGQKLRMSLQEIKEEMKDTDGRPEVKSRVRRLQQEMARKRMLADVPKADVILTNPSHYAVALKYDAATMAAPVLLAKGADFLAERIRAVAGENNVVVVQTPALARAVYYSTELGGEIPQGLYVAVARVLAYVLALARHRRGQGARPNWPDELPIPEELRRDA